MSGDGREHDEASSPGPGLEPGDVAGAREPPETVVAWGTPVPDAPVGAPPEGDAAQAAAEEPRDTAIREAPGDSAGMRPRPRFPAPPVAFMGEAPAIPGFQLMRELGRGGMAVVYEAWQHSLRRTVAIKVMSESLSDRPDMVARFEQEATSVASLNHENVVGVIDRGEADGRFYLVMEYVPGYSLREILGVCGGRLEPRTASYVMFEVARGLAYIHEHGTVHRDVKPANILISEKERVKITDFGLAGLVNAAEDARLTRENIVMGTVDYMAPEQREDSRTADQRADLYSFGVMFYELLTGSLPQGAWQPAQELVEDLDPRLDALIHRCLQRDREKRPQSAEELVEVLAGVCGQPLPGSHQTRAPTPSTVVQVLAGALEELSSQNLTRDLSQSLVPPTPARIARRQPSLIPFMIIIVLSGLTLWPWEPPEAGPERPAQRPRLATEGTLSLQAPRGPRIPGLHPPLQTEPPLSATLTLSGTPATAVALLVPVEAEGEPRLVHPGERLEDVPPGRYRIDMQAADHQPTHQEVVLLPGKELLYRYLLAPAAPTTGLVVLSCEPAGARLTCDGCPSAQLGQLEGERRLELPAGSYRFGVRKEGYVDHIEPVRVRSGETRVIRIGLRPVPQGPAPSPSPRPPTPVSTLGIESQHLGNLNVVSNPPGASVFVEEEDSGRTPLKLRLPPGLYRVRLELGGHEPASADIRVTIDEEARLDWSLARIDGYLDITSVPEGAKVWIDGQPGGNTPVRRLRHAYGAVEVVVEAPGYQRWRRIVSLKPREKLAVRADLESLAGS